MIEYILITLLLILAIVNIYYPFINTNSNKIVNDVNDELIMNKELSDVDKKLEEITSKNKQQQNTNFDNSIPKHTTCRIVSPLKFTDDNKFVPKNISYNILPQLNSLETEKFVNKSIYKLNGLIDNNDCYNAQFKLCNKRNQLDGYEIFTPMQEGCLYPDDKISPYEAAYSQVDKYLSLLPPATGKNTELTNKQRKKKCLNKPSVKIGLNEFGICNKEILKTRCKNLNSQKESIADLNNYVSLDDLNTGVENMKLIYSSCFPEDEPLVC